MPATKGGKVPLNLPTPPFSEVDLRRAMGIRSAWPGKYPSEEPDKSQLDKPPTM